MLLYFAPFTCARIPLIAMEEAGCSVDLRLIAFARGDHRATKMLDANPKGKVPILIVDGRPLTEVVAILTWLNEHFPDARLLPVTGDAFDRATQIADLAWCATTLHPLVSRLNFPIFTCDLPESADRIRQIATDALQMQLAIAEARLASQDHWYGHWSIMDAYLSWIFFRARSGGFLFDAYPSLARSAAATEARPAVARALARETQLANELAAQQLALPVRHGR